jgi:hypothetical protein
MPRALEVVVGDYRESGESGLVGRVIDVSTFEVRGSTPDSASQFHVIHTY